MNRLIPATLAAALLALSAPAAMAQSNIKPSSKFAWGENIGYINCRDAGAVPGTQGVRINGSFLSGFAWAENVGWINFGTLPANNVSYANVNGADSGVNRDPATGNLSGYAWGENVGWINFSGGALAVPANPARFDAAAKRLRGYAWGENIGWINLDNGLIFPAVCAADYNGDGVLNVSDIFAFLTAWFASNPLANFNGVSNIDVGDIFAFLTSWFAGC